MVIVVPILFIETTVLCIHYKIDFISWFLLIIMCVLAPLTIQFIGIITDLKYPRLDAVNDTEVVKQSMSSFVAVIVGFIKIIANVTIIGMVALIINPKLLLFLYILVFLIENGLLYLYISKKCTVKFNELTI